MFPSEISHGPLYSEPKDTVKVPYMAHKFMYLDSEFLFRILSKIIEYLGNMPREYWWIIQLMWHKPRDVKFGEYTPVL